MPDAVMLFAAGFGTRMGDLTRDRPKPLVTVAGKPLIAHAMEIVRAAKLNTVVVNAHYKADQIVDHFAHSDVQVLVESPEILDTGGGLKAALPVLKAETVFTMNTDAVWTGPNPLMMLQDAWRDDMQALLLCIPKDNAIGHNGSGDLDIREDGTSVWGTETIYSGLQIISTDIVSDMGESVFSLKEVWQNLIDANQLHGIVYPGTWCDVGHPGGIALAETMLGYSDV
ncbi:nucleotidyltransferase family protein [Marivita sp. S2033]|uniref:nucleotidyltransferase family protein n=1 Tax=Marivita sp. S2033 TaxID=3373187 RepID=UPI0039820D16